jgi:hypothetical protein
MSYNDPFGAKATPPLVDQNNDIIAPSSPTPPLVDQNNDIIAPSSPTHQPHVDEEDDLSTIDPSETQPLEEGSPDSEFDSELTPEELATLRPDSHLHGLILAATDIGLGILTLGLVARGETDDPAIRAAEQSTTYKVASLAGDIVSLHRGKSKVGSYREVRGHHIHQSASYGKGKPRSTNPNHYRAISIGHGAGFTRSMHKLADAIQLNVNRAIHGLLVKRPEIGPSRDPKRVQIAVSGNGKLSPTPTPWFEDIKAFYSMRAARPAGYESPFGALQLVDRSILQLDASGVRPVRIPQGPKPSRRKP